MKKYIILLVVTALVMAPLIVRIFFWSWFKATFYIHDMETEGRVARLQVVRVIETLSIKPGNAVADIGAGTGLFTRPLARAAGRGGTVYAVDINRTLLDHIEETARKEGITNIKSVTAAEDDPLIPEPIDLIFMCDTLHYVPDKPGYLKTLRRYLKPGGRLAVIGLKDKWPPFHDQYKFTVDDLKRWTAGAGYRLLVEHHFLADEFYMIFTPVK